MKRLTKDYELKESYEFACFNCGHEQMAKPSIMMHVGMNTGAGKCLECKTSLHLEVDIAAGKMISSSWDEHAEQIKKEMVPPVTTHWKAKGA